MTTRHAAALALAAALAAAGCGDGRLKTPGRVVKGGRPFAPPDGQFLRVTFLPTAAGSGDAYVAEVAAADGTFKVAGKDGKGMPPGHYKVVVELDKKRSDQFKGRYGPDNTPFEVDVDADTAEVVIDLDTPPAKKS